MQRKLLQRLLLSKIVHHQIQVPAGADIERSCNAQLHAAENMYRVPSAVPMGPLLK